MSCCSTASMRRPAVAAARAKWPLPTRPCSSALNSAKRMVRLRRVVLASVVTASAIATTAADPLALSSAGCRVAAGPVTTLALRRRVQMRGDPDHRVAGSGDVGENVVQHPSFVDELVPLRCQLEGGELVGDECHRARRIGVVDMAACDGRIADGRRTAEPRHQFLDAGRCDQLGHPLRIGLCRREIREERRKPRRRLVVQVKQRGAGQQFQVVASAA